MQQGKVLRNRWFYLIQLIVDVAIIDISYYLGFYIQRPQLFADGIPLNVIIAIASISILAVIFILAFKLHRCGVKAYFTTVFYALIMLPFLALAAVFTDFLIKGVGIWRRTIFYAVVIQVPAIFIIKWIFYKSFRRMVTPRRSIIIANTIEDASNLYLRINENKHSLFDIKYIISESHDRLYEYINKSSQVIIGSKTILKTEIIEYCATNGFDCTVVPNYREIILNSGKFNNINDVMLCDMKVKMDVETRIIKRAMDLVISSLAIILLSPIMLFVALAIKIDDGGSVFLKQIRVTKNNKEFTILKFRTMIEDAEKKTGAVLAKKNDSRITRIGKFLRAYRLDEIPQLINVFKGEMSMVGPRPERPSLIEKTLDDTPEFSYRTLVKSGVTGLAQTMGRYDTSFDDKLRFDLHYVTNYTLLLDLKIIFYTFHTLITPSVTTGIDEEQKDNYTEIILKLGYQLDDDKKCFIKE